MPLKGGGSIRLDWPGLARTTAQLLEFVPKNPPFKGVGLLGLPIDSEDRFPKLDWALECLKMVLLHLENYAKTGTVDVKDRDGQGLVCAMVGIEIICKNRWGESNLHRDIPIEIAAIARTVSAANKLTAQRLRGKRSNFLRTEKERVLHRDQELTWKQVLRQLEGDGVVHSWDDRSIAWVDQMGTCKTTMTVTFKNWPKKSQA